MKTKNQLLLTTIMALISSAWFSNLMAQETNAAPMRIGIYDSRALAYAYFVTPEHQRQISKMVQAARAAQAAGQTNRFNELRADLQAAQAEIHREGFSTAPATNAMAFLKDRIPRIEKEAGVTALISKWNAQALKQYRSAKKVDVTDRLVHELNPNLTEKQLKVISAFKKSKPPPLKQCDELIRKGKI